MADAERRRLDLRARRIRVTIAELRRLHDGDAHGGMPSPLGQALAAFADELADIESRLAER